MGLESAAMATEAEIKLIPVDCEMRKSPPRLVVPAPDPVGDDYLFSPGVETPGHRLENKVCSSIAIRWEGPMGSSVGLRTVELMK